MNLARFTAEREERWAEVDALCREAGGRPARLGPDGVRRLGSLYRATAGDLALARRAFPGDPVVGVLEARVTRARALVYAEERRRFGIGWFVTTGYWRRVRERPAVLLASFLLLMGPFTLACVWGTRDPVRAAGLAPGSYSSVVNRDSANFRLDPGDKAAVSSQIFTNNIRVAILAFAAGIIVGLGTVLVLVYQGVVLGAVFGLTIDAGNAGPLFRFVFPHGVLELSCIIVAGAAGMRMGWAIVCPGYRRRGEALVAEARAAAEIAVGTALMLVFCGIVEGSLSTSGLALGPAIGIGLLIGGAFWTLVLVRGRPPVAPRVEDSDVGLLAGAGDVMPLAGAGDVTTPSATAERGPWRAGRR